MTAGDAALEMPGDLSPGELAARLRWPPAVVDQLIDTGLIVRTATGWSVDAADLPHRWAAAQWGGHC